MVPLPKKKTDFFYLAIMPLSKHCIGYITIGSFVDTGNQCTLVGRDSAT